MNSLWLPPVLLAAIMATLLLSLAFLYIYIIERKKYLLVWTCSWMFYTMHLGVCPCNYQVSRFQFFYCRILLRQCDQRRDAGDRDVHVSVPEVQHRLVCGGGIDAGLDRVRPLLRCK